MSLKGSVVKRKDKFYLALDLPRGLDGKRKQKWLSNPNWRTKKDVEREAPRIIADAQDGLVSIGESAKYSEMLDQWHESVKISLRHNSLRSYRWAVQHLKTHLGKMKVSQIKPAHLQEFINKLSTGGMSNTSIRLVFAAMRKSLQQAVDWGVIRRNPSDKVARPSKKKYQTKVYDAEAMRKLLTACKGTLAYMPVLIAISTGMRRSEIAALRWCDIDFEQGNIHVQNTLNEAGVLQPVKTQLSARVILMPKALIKELKNHQHQHEYVISRPDGRSYNPSYIWRIFKNIIRENGLPDTRFQDLRHAHATHLIMQNVPVKTVSERLGHYSTAFTQDIYGHVLRPMQEKAAAVLDEMLETDQ